MPARPVTRTGPRHGRRRNYFDGRNALRGGSSSPTASARSHNFTSINTKISKFPPPRATPPAAPCLALLLSLGAATPIKPDLLTGLVWRNIGPFRGGRVSAVSGAIGEPGVYYIGLPAGGVWKTTSAGETWYPVFDAIKEVSSIGAVEVAPSRTNVIYVGAGDKVSGGGVNVGNGIYKSEDAGATWRHLGLDDSRVIPSILVDPKNPDLVLVAAEGNLWKKSEDRGVYRSTDGGRSWTKTLYLNDSTGVQKIARAFDRPDVIFATTIRHYSTPGPPRRARRGRGPRPAPATTPPRGEAPRAGGPGPPPCPDSMAASTSRSRR